MIGACVHHIFKLPQTLSDTLYIYIHKHYIYINTILITGSEYYFDHNMNFLSYTPELPSVGTRPSGYLLNRVSPREFFWSVMFYVM